MQVQLTDVVEPNPCVLFVVVKLVFVAADHKRSLADVGIADDEDVDFLELLAIFDTHFPASYLCTSHR